MLIQELLRNGTAVVLNGVDCFGRAPILFEDIRHLLLVFHFVEARNSPDLRCITAEFTARGSAERNRGQPRWNASRRGYRKPDWAGAVRSFPCSRIRQSRRPCNGGCIKMDDHSLRLRRAAQGFCRSPYALALNNAPI